MTTCNPKSVPLGYPMKPISEQPLIRARNENRQYSENDGKTNFTPTHEDSGNSGINSPDNTGASKSPTDIPGTDDNNTSTDNKNGILKNFLGNSDDDTLTAFTLYRNKKLLTQSMMDIALFSANANQLRNVLEANDGHNAISIICIVLLVFSIILQIIVGITLLLSIRYNVTNCDERKMAFKFGNYVIVGTFLITVVNVLISAFGGPRGTG